MTVRILLIKQRIRRGPAIESSIEDFVEAAFRSTPGVELETYDMGDAIRRAEDQYKPANPRALQQLRFRETETCLRYIREHDHQNIFLLNGYLTNLFNPRFFQSLSAITRKIITWQLDDPYYVDLILPFLPHLDVVFTVDSSTIPLYQRYEKTTEWLPLACQPEVHKPLDDYPDKYQSDVCFIGVPFKGSNRVRTIDALAPELSRLNTRIIGATEQDTWKANLQNYGLVRHQILDTFVPMEEAVKYYGAATINLNLHKDSFGHAWDRNSHRLMAQSPCERMFSIAGCGGFQLIDSTRPDLARIFRPGQEIVTFDDASDLSKKIRYYLQNEQERVDIARAALETARNCHTYAHRIQRILDVSLG